MTFEAGRMPSGEAVQFGGRALWDRPRGISLAKLAFDKAFAAVALFTLAPVMALVALALRLGDPGPIIFKHKRIGQHGETFYCYKFRSMRVDADVRLTELLEIDPVARAEWERDQKLQNDPRITAVGRFLRKTSLDELPQFWNVLIGDMSIVGPRPIIQSEAEKYGEHFVDYCAVRPGITGAWQVSGRNLTSYPERVALDVDYVRNVSLIGDLRIVLRTVSVVLMQKGAT